MMTDRRYAWTLGAAVFAAGCQSHRAPEARATENPEGSGVEATTSRGQELLAKARDAFGASREAVSLLASADVERFDLESGALLARVEAPRFMAPDVEVRLPKAANGALVLESKGVRADVRPHGFAESSVEWSERVAVYADVSPGVHAFRRVLRDGVEDLYQVETPREEIAFSFDLATAGFAGLRLIDDTLELLDASGNPSLRTSAPIAFDANGHRRQGTISVEGCAYDRDVRGPWGRPVTAPGAATCTIVSKLDGRGLEYPVLVDPAWVSTFNTKQNHAYHKMVYLGAGADKGKVLLAGGNGSAVAATELYDPAKTSWARSGVLPDGTGMGVGTGMVALSDGTVVLAGGFPGGASFSSTARATVFVRSPKDSTWNTGSAMSSGRAWHAMHVVKDAAGKEYVFVAGGQLPWSPSGTTPPLRSAEWYDPDPDVDSWKALGNLTTARTHVGSVVLSDGRVLVAGGDTNSTFGLSSLSSTEIFAPLEVAKPGGIQWTNGPAMMAARAYPIVVALADGNAVVAGGGTIMGMFGRDPTPIDSVEVFNGTTFRLVATKLSNRRMNFVGEKLADGKVLFAGGNSSSFAFSSPVASDSADIYDPVKDALTSAPNMSSPRLYHASVFVPGKGVLVTGGHTTGMFASETTLSEIFDTTLGIKCGVTDDCASGLSCVDGVCCQKASCPEGQSCNAPGHEGVCTKPKGAACVSNLECASGYCVTGFCCENACAGGCKACNNAGMEGTCLNAAAGTDPGGFCTSFSDAICGRKCDGRGSCGGYAPMGTKCGTSAVDGGTGSFCSVQECTSFGSCFTTRFKCGLTCTTFVDCDEATKMCKPVASSVKPGFCVIDSKCWSYGDVNPTNPCQLCDPPTSKTAWSTSAACMDAGPEAGSDAAADADAVTPVGDAEPTIEAGADAKTDAAADGDASTPTDGANAEAGNDDSGNADAGDDAAAVDATADAATEPLPEGKACGCRTAGSDTSTSMGGALAALGLALVVARRRRGRGTGESART